VARMITSQKRQREEEEEGARESAGTRINIIGPNNAVETTLNQNVDIDLPARLRQRAHWDLVSRTEVELMRWIQTILPDKWKDFARRNPDGITLKDMELFVAEILVEARNAFSRAVRRQELTEDQILKGISAAFVSGVAPTAPAQNNPPTSGENAPTTPRSDTLPNQLRAPATQPSHNKILDFGTLASNVNKRSAA
jgi:hypothetical protein